MQARRNECNQKTKTNKHIRSPAPHQSLVSTRLLMTQHCHFHFSPSGVVLVAAVLPVPRTGGPQHELMKNSNTEITRRLQESLAVRPGLGAPASAGGLGSAKVYRGSGHNFGITVERLLRSFRRTITTHSGPQQQAVAAATAAALVVVVNAFLMLVVVAMVVVSVVPVTV